MLEAYMALDQQLRVCYGKIPTYDKRISKPNYDWYYIQTQKKKPIVCLSIDVAGYNAIFAYENRPDADTKNQNVSISSSHFVSPDYDYPKLVEFLVVSMLVIW